MLNDVRVSRDFSLREFQCRCGCGCVKIEPALLAAIQKYRELTGGPVTVTSGYRCARHNAQVRGAKNSAHMYGRAADVVCPAALQEERAKLAKEAGFAKVIKYPARGFLHLQV